MDTARCEPPVILSIIEGARMIERYTRPEMARVWSEENRLDTWLRVEILVCEGWAREGAISAEDSRRFVAPATTSPAPARWRPRPTMT
jgi:Adenylosuccinate lyase